MYLWHCNVFYNIKQTKQDSHIENNVQKAHLSHDSGMDFRSFDKGICVKLCIKSV